MIPLVRAMGKRTASGPWTPASLPSLGGWWDADDASTFTYSSGSVVSQWNDKSGLGRHMLQATTSKQPSRTGTINSRSAVVFDGTTDGLATASFGALTQPTTLLLVARSTAASGQRDALLTFDGSGQGGRIFRTSGGTIDAYQGSFLSTTLSWGTTGPHSVVALLNGASSKIAADSGAWVTGNSGSQPSGDRLSIGAYMDASSEFWQGEICEAVLMTAAISDSDRNSWFSYCATKWGTP